MKPMSRSILDVATVLSLFLCLLCAWASYSAYSFWIGGTIATTQGSDHIVNDARFLTASKLDALAAVVFAILPLVRLARRITRR
jgi:hypothetical protein